MSKKHLNISKMSDGDKTNQRKRKFEEDIKNSNTSSTSNNELGNYLDNSELHNYSSFQNKIRKRTSLFEKDISKTSTFITNVMDTAEKVGKPPEDGTHTPINQKPKFNPSLLNSPFYPAPTMYGGAGACRLSLMSGLEAKARNLLGQEAGSSTWGESKPEQINVKSSKCEDNSMSQTARRIFNLLEQYSSPPISTKRPSHLDNTFSPYSRLPPSYLLDKSKRNTSHVSLLDSELKQKQGFGKLQELSIPTIPSLILMHHKRKLMDETTEAARRIASSHSSALSDSPSSYTIRDNGEKRFGRSTSVIRTKVSRKMGQKTGLDEPLPPLNLPNAVLPMQGVKLQTFNLPKIASVPKLSEKREATEAPKKRSYEFAKPLTVADITKNIAAKNDFVFSRPLSTSMKYDKKNEASKSNPIPLVNFKYEPPKNVEPRSSPKDYGKRASGQILFPDFTTSRLRDCSDCQVSNKNADAKCLACGSSKLKQNSTENVGSVADFFKSANKEPTENKSNSLSLSNDKLNSTVKLGSPAQVKVKFDPFKSVAQTATTNSLNVEVPVTSPEKCLTTSAKLSASDFTKHGNWTCSTCWVSNKFEDSKCAACGTSEASQGKAVTAGITNKSDVIVCNSTNSSKFKYPIKGDALPLLANQFKAAGSWNCKDCWVSNKEDHIKCIACGASKSAEIKSQLETFSLSNKSSDWSCKDCWVSNKSSNLKCVACGGSNPSQSTSSGSDKPLPNNSNLIEDKNKTANWECKDCWVSNKYNVAKCIACGGIRYKSEPEIPNNKLTNSTHKTFSGDFKNIIEQQNSLWECPDCLTRNENTKTKCVCCTGLKPGTQKLPEESKFTFSNQRNTFKFGIDKAGTDNSLSNSLKPPINSVVKPTEGTITGGFKFGIPATTTSASTSFSFGIPKDSDSKIVNSISKINSDNNKSIGSQPIGSFVFGVPQNASLVEPKPSEEPPAKAIPLFNSSENKKDQLENLPVNNIKEVKADNDNEKNFSLFNPAPVPGGDIGISTVIGQASKSSNSEGTNKRKFIFGSADSEKPKLDDEKEDPKKPAGNAIPLGTTSTATVPAFTFGSVNSLSAFKTPETDKFTFVSSTNTDANNISSSQPKILNAFGTETKGTTPFTFGSSATGLSTGAKGLEPAKPSGLFGVDSTLTKKTDSGSSAFGSNISFNFSSSNNSIQTPKADFKSALNTNVNKTETSPFSTTLAAQVSSSPFTSPLSSVFSSKGGNSFSNQPKVNQPEGLFKTPGGSGSVAGGLFSSSPQQTPLGAATLPSLNIFGATGQATLPATQSQSIFGMPSGTNQPQGVGFGSPATSNTSLSSGIFGNVTQNSTIPVTEPRPNLFQPSGGMFGSPQNNAPNLSTSSLNIFGSAPNPAGSSTFAAVPSPFGQAALPSAPLNAGFNFGSTTSVPSVFSFGQSTAAAPANPNATFQFGLSANAAPSFNPEIQSQFNFNVGASPAGSRSLPAPRKTKRAMRRVTPR